MNALNKLLDALLDIRSGAPTEQDSAWQVLWKEPESPTVNFAIEAAQTTFLSDLSEKQRTYLECSFPRFKFVLDRAIKHMPQGGRNLDLGCAPGYISILLHSLGYQIHGIDLNDCYVGEYPDGKWLRLLNVQQVNVEQAPLPFSAASFDGVIFTEILEHVAITHPGQILREIRRVLKTTGYLILTTPNVANISHILALAQGNNIFWRPEMFYGSTDRHNREYTPREVISLLESEGFSVRESFLFNGPNNWNSATAELIYKNWKTIHDTNSPLLGNTIFVTAQPKPTSDNTRSSPPSSDRT